MTRRTAVLGSAMLVTGLSTSLGGFVWWCLRPAGDATGVVLRVAALWGGSLLGFLGACVLAEPAPWDGTDDTDDRDEWDADAELVELLDGGL